jgi:hypothetical protein
VAHEQLEQGHLLRRQGELGVVGPGSVGRGIEAKVTDFEHGRALPRPSADERPHARRELGEAERLDQVIVSADVEASHLVLDGGASREHQHGWPAPQFPQSPADGESVDLGEHHVEHDRGVVVLGAHPQPVGAVGGDVDGIAVVAKAAFEERGHSELVFDDENSHGARV